MDKESLKNLYVRLTQNAFNKYFKGKYRLEDVIDEFYSLFLKSYLEHDKNISISGILTPFKNNVVSLKYAKGITRLTDQIENQVLLILKDRLKNVDETQKETVRRIFEDVMLSERQKAYVKTWVNTIEASANQAQFIKSMLQAGIKYFKYVGPEPEREFCKKHYNKVYTIDDIKKLDNGQGLDPLFFCGGYNCRHRWVASSFEEWVISTYPINTKTQEKQYYYSKEELKDKIKELFNINIVEEAENIFSDSVSNIEIVSENKNSRCIEFGKEEIKVEISKKHIKNNYITESTLYHEFGHAFVFRYKLIDLETGIYEGKIVTKNVYYNNLFINKFEEQRSLAWKNLGKIKSKLESLISEEVKNKYISKGYDVDKYNEQVGVIYDYFGSLTNGYIGGGHTKNYYLDCKNSKAKHEWFANMSSAYFLNMEIMKEEFPEFYELIENSFKEIVYETIKKPK